MYIGGTNDKIDIVVHSFSKLNKLKKSQKRRSAQCIYRNESRVVFQKGVRNEYVSQIRV
jgi:hypothetical protein